MRGVVQSPARRAARMPRREPSTQSSRVWLTISMIVGTPRPSSPTSGAQVPSNSISLEALERLPSLSFSRWMRNALRVAVGQRSAARGSTTGRRRRLREDEEGVAHRRRAEPLVAGERVLAPAAADRRARASCWRARRSRPASRSSPCRTSAPRLLGGGDEARVVRRSEVRRGSHSAATLGLRRAARDDRVGHRDRAAVAGLDLAPACMKLAARATCAPGAARPTAARAAPCADARPPSARARRGGTRPRRCGGRSGRGCAAPAGSRSPVGRAPDASAAARARRPRATRSRAQPPPSRSSASTSGRFGANTL